MSTLGWAIGIGMLAGTIAWLLISWLLAVIHDTEAATADPDCLYDWTR